MYLIYVDESGKPCFKDPCPNFVLASIMVQELDWLAIDTSMKKIKARYFPDHRPEHVEFHLRDIVHRKGIYSGRPLNERREILAEIYDALSSFDLKVMAIAVDKRNVQKGNLDIEKSCFGLLFGRLCRYLDQRNEAAVSRGNPPQHAILMVDAVQRKYDDRLRRKIRELLTNDRYYWKNRYIIEDPFFTRSSYRNISQLADAVAYCIRRCTDPRFPKDDTFDPVFSRAFELIRSKTPAVRDETRELLSPLPLEKVDLEVSGEGATIPP